MSRASVGQQPTQVRPPKLSMPRIGRTVRTLRLWAAATVIAVGATLGVAGSASADPSIPTLPVGATPDPWLHCAVNNPLKAQVDVLEWQVIADGITGTPGQNDWKCRYLVSATIPYGSQLYRLPPTTWTFPVDFAKMCAQQVPGSRLVWTPGPATGIGGSPWSCV